MTPGWHFQKHQRQDKVRNPIQGEFFSDEAVANPAQALVREAVQNSMDARRDGHEGPVRIRIFVSETSALPEARARRWFDGAWAHFRARHSGLRSVAPRPSECRFVTIEDFGTTGLTGDVHQGRVGDGGNRFFNFWRAEGVSEKSGKHGGRWGVGKTVFPRSSEVNAFFGLTVRADDAGAALMGQCVLRHHQVGDVEFTPDAYFGMVESDQFVLPARDPACLSEFRRDFRVSRDLEPGLSVVVTYSDPAVTCRTAAEAIVRDYFFPILTGELLVDIEGPESGAMRLDAKSLVPLVEQEASSFAELEPILALARWVVQSEPVHTSLAEHGADGRPTWDERSIPETVRAELRHSYLAGRLLALRVPVTVRPTHSAAARSHFDVYLQKDPLGKGSKPVYVRSGIIIPDVRERRVHGHRLHALVVCEDEPIARLLGDAETPAHTHWSKDAHNFRGMYEDGASYLSFVAHAPRSIAEILSATVGGRDRYSLASLFPRLKVEADAQVPAIRNKPGKDTTPGTPPATGKPRYVVDSVTGGAAIRAGPGLTALPARLRAEFAYDVRRGNALSKYDPADFRLEDLAVRARDARAVLREGNVLDVEPSSLGFRIEVTGFDIHRDVYVRVREVKSDG